MGFIFRKSAKFGPFRLTLSKRGVGTSVGGSFWRMSSSPSGRVTRTLRVPGTGISWRSSRRHK